MKVLNLYSGIGGNRKNWDSIRDDLDITAVEIDPKIAKIYQDFFPNDKVIVADAHQYLLDHFKEFDFIWSSPPCPSHSKFRFMTTKMIAKGKSRPIIYPDMSLYQEIILLKHYYDGKYVVENVKGYYEPLIKPQESGRHYFWANFVISNIKNNNNNFIKGHATQMGGLDISRYSGIRKDQTIRNCVEPELGLHIFQEAFREYKTLF
jgi:DNA (cytosine-5)-methyltransferase 1